MFFFFETNKKVVQRIKLRPNETELLVVDDETDEYYASRGLTIKSTNPNVIRKRSSPAPEPARKISSSSSESESEQQKQAARLQQQQQQQQAYVTNGQRRESSSSEGEVKFLDWWIDYLRILLMQQTNGRKMILFDTRVEQDWSNAPAPRFCHVIKWNENDGFGFHLLADKKRKVNLNLTLTVAWNERRSGFSVVTGPVYRQSRPWICGWSGRIETERQDRGSERTQRRGGNSQASGSADQSRSQWNEIAGHRSTGAAVLRRSQYYHHLIHAKCPEDENSSHATSANK